MIERAGDFKNRSIFRTLILSIVLFCALASLAPGPVGYPPLPAAGLPSANLAAKATDANVAPILVIYVKNVTVRTTGSPQDVATVTVPAGFTRYKITGGASGSYIYAETAAGTLAAATFNVFDGAGGTGTTLLSASANAPAAANTLVVFGNAGVSTSSSGTIYIRQLVDSANAGTISFYMTLYPLL